jgi:putative Ca2+/H+ antiporter (TMEM165/GDT1 family)
MLTALLISLGVVFVAELGDKSQLMTMTYALRHHWWVVLSGVAVAAFLVHGLSVTVGHFLGLTLPERPIAFAAAISFFVFAAWTWRERKDRGAVPAAPEHRFVLLAVVSSYVLAELGDKTMLATVALASDHNWAGVWIGATVAMVLADGLAIAAGALLHRRLPERLLHGLASVLFVLFGLWLLFDAALGWPWVAVVATASAAVLAAAVAIAAPLRARGAERKAAE